MRQARTTRESTAITTERWLHTKAAQCPPTPFYNYARQHGWPTEYREHVNKCSYCQRSIGISYRLGCPDEQTIREYVEHNLNADAIAFHVERDGCDRCAERINSEQSVGRQATDDESALFGTPFWIPKASWENSAGPNYGHTSGAEGEQVSSSECPQVQFVHDRGGTMIVIALPGDYSGGRIGLKIEGVAKPILLDVEGKVAVARINAGLRGKNVTVIPV